jgi:hypothetical protein
VSFDEALSGFGFHANQGRAPRGAKLFTAEPNRYLTYSLHAYEDGTALFTWEFALGGVSAHEGDPGRLGRDPQPVHSRFREPPDAPA